MRFCYRPGQVWVLVISLLPGYACRREARLPELPAISLEGFVPAIRAEVEKAFAQAHSAPRDPAANGRLGMVLHAHEQHGSAEVCYERALLLDSNSFQWLYYLAVVQEA